MTKMLKYITAILFLVPFVCFSQTKEVKTELKRIRNAYLSNQEFSFDVEAYSYSTKADKTAELISKGYVKKNKSDYYSNFDRMELVINKNKTLLIDNERKKMTLYDTEPIAKDHSQFDVNIDSLTSISDSIILRPDENGQKHLSCYSKNGYIKQTEIWADSKSGFVTRILYYYVASNENFEIPANRVEVFYKNIRMEKIGTDYFSLDKFYKSKGQRCVPLGKYSAYKLNHYTSKS